MSTSVALVSICMAPFLYVLIGKVIPWFSPAFDIGGLFFSLQFSNEPSFFQERKIITPVNKAKTEILSPVSFVYD